MQGRIEVDEKIERSLEAMVDLMPECASEWYYALKARGVTAKSRRDYVNKIKNFFSAMGYDLEELNVTDITSTDLTKYFSLIQYRTDKDGNKIKNSDSFRNATWFALNNFFEYHYNAGHIEKNYMMLVKPMKNVQQNDPAKKIMLTSNDFKKMLCHVPGEDAVMKKRNKAILLLYMTTGMRRDALCQINISDINFETKELTVIDKGEKMHTYMLCKDAYDALNDWLEVRDGIHHGQTDAAFITYQGNRVTGNAMYNMITTCTTRTFGKKIGPHKLRAGLCSILYEQTHDIEFVRRAIGHSQVTTTQKYIVTDGNEKAIASEIIGGLL